MNRMFRFNRLNTRLAPLAALLIALVAPAGAATGTGNQPSDVGGCQKLQVPPGNEVAFHVYAEGSQIYRWNGASWSFVAPAAILYADAAGTNTVGLHFAGPSWEGVDGSKVAGSAMATCTPNPNSIPWLLLGAVSKGGPGMFNPITFVQRVDTVGGTAPTTPGAAPGEVARVPYSAVYVFYRAQP
jgi:hypothetical protein